MIGEYYRETAYLITQRPSCTYPYDLVTSSCSAFRCAIDTVGSQERWIAGDIAAISTHWLACETGEAIGAYSSGNIKQDKVRWGSRYFDVTGVADDCALRPGHHKEVYLKEVSRDGL